MKKLLILILELLLGAFYLALFVGFIYLWKLLSDTYYLDLPESFSLFFLYALLVGTCIIMVVWFWWMGHETLENCFYSWRQPKKK